MPTAHQRGPRFIADTLQIDGYFRYKNGDNRRAKLPADTSETDTSWYNRAGNIATLWIYDCETAVPHTQETYTKNTAGQVTSTTSVDGTTGDVVTVNASGVETARKHPVATVTLDSATIDKLVRNADGDIDFTNRADYSVDEATLSLDLTQAGLEKLKTDGAAWSCARTPAATSTTRP